MRRWSAAQTGQHQFVCFGIEELKTGALAECTWRWYSRGVVPELNVELTRFTTPVAWWLMPSKDCKGFRVLDWVRRGINCMPGWEGWFIYNVGWSLNQNARESCYKVLCSDAAEGSRSLLGWLQPLCGLGTQLMLLGSRYLAARLGKNQRCSQSHQRSFSTGVRGRKGGWSPIRGRTGLCKDKFGRPALGNWTVEKGNGRGVIKSFQRDYGFFYLLALGRKKGLSM